MQNRVGKIEEERRTEEVEARKRADVTASLVRRDKHGKAQPALVLANRGPAVARDVPFDVGDLDRQRILSVRGAERLPIPRLVAGSDFTFDLVIASETPLAVTVTLTWTDGVGPQSEQVTLSTT